MSNRYRIANDNAPASNSKSNTANRIHGRRRHEARASGAANENLHTTAAGTAPSPFARHANMTERPTMILSRPVSALNYDPVWTPKLRRDAARKPNPASNAIYHVVAVFWALSILANIAAIAFAPTNTVHLLVVISAIWTSLAMMFTAQSREQTALAEMASLAGLAAFALSLYVTSIRFGINAPPAAGAGLTAFASIGLGLLTGSKLALRASAVLGLAWAILTLALTPYTSFSLAFPVLLGLQAYANATHKDGAALGVSLLAGYIWVFGGLASLTSSGQITALMAASALFAGGLTHSRVGKIMSDRKTYSGLAHSCAGWTAMMIGLIATQDFWTSPDRVPWSVMQSTAGSTLIWGALIIAGAGLIALLGIWRSGFNVTSTVKSIAAGGFVIALSAASLNYAKIAEPLLVYNVSPSPMIGVIVCGAAIAACAGMVINGFRRNQPILIALGILVMALSAFIGLPVLTTSFELGAIFIGSAFLSGLILAAYIKAPS